ncbi:MAG: phosphoenolpyruvate--protein phosphotransferase [Treponema sp.]
MERVKGIVAAEGYAYTKAFVLTTNRLTLNRTTITASSIHTEQAALSKALAKVREEITALQAKSYSEGAQEQGDIFGAYLEILNDDELCTDINRYIAEKKVDLNTALMDVCNDYAADMAALDDPYMQARADDFRQLFSMIADAHNGDTSPELSSTEDFILVAQEIGPADMAKIDKRFLKGIVTATGSRTCHAAIVCRAAGIPMLSGISQNIYGICTGTNLIIDGSEGCLVIEPDAAAQETYRQIIQQQIKEKEHSAYWNDKPALTGDGIPIILTANAGVLADIETALTYNADGIGLFRTELLFMEHKGRLPNEEEQFTAYKSVLQKMGSKPVVFRTLDAGGDKCISALGIPREDNPFLGWRAIRYCLKTPELFRVQLRALLRASVFGTAQILLPMISTEQELLQARKLLDSVYEELQQRGIQNIPRVPLGIMIETPAAALIADTLACSSDFFSIGSNDLTQYTIAVDRGNEYVSDLYDELHPAVLYLIRRTVEAAAQAGIRVHICGEMAGDVRCTAALLKAGIREFSMSANRIPYIKAQLAMIHCGSGTE